MPDAGRVSYLVQTTLAVDEVEEIVQALRERFPQLSAPGSDDICYATTNRQRALRAVAHEADVVLVVGSRNSSNSNRLVEMAERMGTPAHLVDEASDIDLGWLAGAGTVAVTAGASAPTSLVDDVVVGTPRPRARRRRGTRGAAGGPPLHPAEGGAAVVSMPFRQSVRIGRYLAAQRLRGRKRFPLLVELEPLFACNLACAGCGKIQHPADDLRRRMPVEQAVDAMRECGAPMVSIAGGEPLMHPEIDRLVNELVARKKYVFLCTNAVLVRK